MSALESNLSKLGQLLKVREKLVPTKEKTGVKPKQGVSFPGRKDHYQSVRTHRELHAARSSIPADHTGVITNSVENMSGCLERMKTLTAEVKSKLREISPIPEPITEELEAPNRYHEHTQANFPRTKPHHGSQATSTTTHTLQQSKRSHKKMPTHVVVSREVRFEPHPDQDGLRDSFRHLRLPSQLVVLPDTSEDAESIFEETRRSVHKLRERALEVNHSERSEPSKLLERKRAALAALRLRAKPIN